MINSNCRRQPTPTDILESDLFTEFDKLVFLYIWSRVRSKDWPINFTQAGRDYSLNMKRWQVIFKVSKFSEIVNCDPKKVDRSIKKLKEWYSGMEIKGMPFWLLITWVSYDEIVNMENEMENGRRMEGEWEENERRANKTVKTVKTVESKKSKQKKETIQEIDPEKIICDKENIGKHFTSEEIDRLRTKLTLARKMVENWYRGIKNSKEWVFEFFEKIKEKMIIYFWYEDWQKWLQKVEDCITWNEKNWLVIESWMSQLNTFFKEKEFKK